MKKNILDKRKFLKMSAISGLGAFIASSLPFGFRAEKTAKSENASSIEVKIHPNAIKRNIKG